MRFPWAKIIRAPFRRFVIAAAVAATTGTIAAAPPALAQDPPPADEGSVSPSMEPGSGAPPETVRATFETPPDAGLSLGEPLATAPGAAPADAPPPADAAATPPPAEANLANTPTSPPAEGEPLGMELPAISAKQYDLKVERVSGSKKMVLFGKATGAMPDLGRVFLLRQGAAPIMGFRVVKIYADKLQIAAKRIKDYPGQGELAEAISYRAYEKVGEITSVPPNTPADITELNELEAPSDANAPIQGDGGDATGGDGAGDSVAARSGPPDGTPSDTLDGEGEEGSGDEDPDRAGETPDGFVPNFASFDVGAFRAINLPASPYSTGFGFSYTRMLSRNARGGGLGLELGIGYYKNSGDVDETEEVEDPLTHLITDEPTGEKISQSFTMIPIAARMKYQFSLDEGWGYYLYAGGMYNHVASSFGATQTQKDLAKTAVIALGAGVIIPTGPSWYFKVNVGTDFLGAGLMLRY